jgi:hypothetical protein
MKRCYFLPIILFILLMGCQATQVSSPKSDGLPTPPIPLVTVEGKQIRVFQSTYCWSSNGKGECADYAAPPEQLKGHKPVEVKEGSEMKITFPFEPIKGSLSASLWQEEHPIKQEIKNGNTMDLPKEKGYYIFIINGKWKEGDSSYVVPVQILVNENNQIPSQIGEPQNIEDNVLLQSWSDDELYKKTGYAKPTGKGFGGLMVAQPGTGINKPGAEEGYYVEKIPEGRKVRLQLVERGPNLEKLKMVEEKLMLDGKGLTVKLPEKENVIYTLSAEMLNEEGNVIDSVVHVLYVPYQKMNAKLSLDKEVYEANDTMSLKLENWGPTSLFFGRPFFIERFENGTWKKVDFDLFFTLEGLGLDEGRTFTQEINLDRMKLKPGKYRIVKEIEVTATNLKSELANEFQIK